MKTEAEMGVMLPQAKDHQKKKETRNDPLLEAWEEPGPADTLILDISPPESWKNKFLLF